MNFKLLTRAVLLCVIIISSNSCKNNIIERAGSEYFPIKEGNWWRYANNDLYEPEIVSITVEPVDTLLQREVYPFNISGEFHYFSKDIRGIKEYIEMTHNYGGSIYTILQGYITRLELPLVSGNRFIDSLSDSLDFFGEWIKARYLIDGLVSDYQDDELYGEVYKVIISISESIATPDSTISSQIYLEEYYAPGIGLVRFKNSNSEFSLTDYHLE